MDEPLGRRLGLLWNGLVAGVGVLVLSSVACCWLLAMRRPLAALPWLLLATLPWLLLAVLLWRPLAVLPWLSLGVLLWLLLAVLLLRPLARLAFLPLTATLHLLLSAAAGHREPSDMEWLLELSGLSDMSYLAESSRKVLRVGTRLLMDLGKACLADARSLFKLLAALWDSLAGSVLSARKLLVPFMAQVANRDNAVAIRLWPHCQLTFKVLCSATVVFISVYFLVYNLTVVLHSGAQSLHTVSVTLWDSSTSLVSRVTDLLAAFLAHVSSGVTAISTVLWWPCRMASELLGFITKVFTSIFFIGVFILKLLLFIAFPIVICSVIYYNREVLWVLKRRVLGSFHRRQGDVRRLYQGAVLTLHRARNSRPWHRLVDWVLRVTSRSQAGRMINQRRDQLDAGQVPQPPTGAGQRPQMAREEPGTSRQKATRNQQLNVTAGNTKGTPDNDPWVLLKEQEERKKCVICQDQTKTVLLLPCRHLCLCQECTEVLLQKDQHKCPLCREEIVQTVTVYL